MSRAPPHPDAHRPAAWVDMSPFSARPSYGHHGLCGTFRRTPDGKKFMSDTAATEEDGMDQRLEIETGLRSAVTGAAESVED